VEAQWSNSFAISFASGALAGMFTALVTTPFDVVKTRYQVELLKEAAADSASNTEHKVRQPRTGVRGAYTMMKDIWKTEGLRGLFLGAPARVSKVAPACAIMISSYEVFKGYFSAQVR
jgi:solute carrier family 25 protein 39/40